MKSFVKLNEYINRDDGVEGTLLIPKLIMPTLIEEVEKALIPREMASMVIGPNQIQGATFNVNLEAPDTMNIRRVGEGAEIPLDQQTYDVVTFTPVKFGVAIRITREMMEDSQFELLQRYIRIAGKRFAENETNLILGTLDGADTTVSGGAAITIANLTTAMFNVEQQDFRPTDFLVGNDVANDLRNIDTFVEANKAGNTDMLDRGFIGIVYGLSVARFSTNAGTNAVSTSSYVFDRSQAYGIAIARDLTIENFELPTYDMEGAVITQRIDVQLFRSKAVSKITTS